MNIGVLVSGRGSNLQAIIDSIESGRIKNAKISVVISNKSDAYALERAKKHGIEAVFIDHKKFETREKFDREVVKVLEKHNVELVLLAGFMRILSPYFVRKYKNRIMNIHPALLPSFAGSTHAQWDAVEYGVKISGCSVHFVDEGVDTGPIIIQHAVPVKEDDTGETLAARIIKWEHKIYPEAVRLFVEGKLKVEGRKVKVLK